MNRDYEWISLDRVSDYKRGANDLFSEDKLI